MKIKKLKRCLAAVMAMAVTMTGFGQGAGALAAPEYGNSDADDEIVLYEADVRTDLDDDEVAVAEDINVLKNSDYDVTDVKDGISYNEDKVSVTYDNGRSNFNISETGKYDTYYVAEPLSGKKAYLIRRTVSVDEPQIDSVDGSENGTEEDGDSDDGDPDPAQHKDMQSDVSDGGSTQTDSDSIKEEQTEADDKSSEKKEDSSTKDMESGKNFITSKRSLGKEKEIPLSAGEIEGIESSRATFTIHLDEGQEAEIISEESENNVAGTENDLDLDESNKVAAHDGKSGNVVINAAGSILESVLSLVFPAERASAATKNKDSMKVSYSGYACYCGRKTGIKYISESGDYKEHLVYCMDMNRNTTNGTVNAGGKIKAQITFCLVNGARTLGGKCHTAKYSVDSASADYFITSGAIHVLNGEVSLSYYNDGSAVYGKIAEMVSDAKKLDKNSYNLETGLTKSVSYTITPSATTWKKVSDGLYKTSEKFVRSKSGSITDVKYVIKGAPAGLTTGEIKKDASDIVDEKDLKKFDICVAQTDKEKASSNFYLYANEDAMKKILAEKSTIKVQAKAYADEKGGRKWTPSVVSQQKITFLEDFNTLSAKATVKVASDFKPGSFSFIKTDTYTGTPLAGATYYLYEDKECEDILCELTSDPNSPGLYSTGVQTITQDTYYLKEVDGPDGYQIDETVYQIGSEYITFYDAKGNVSKAAKKTFVHNEYPEPVGIIVNKKDAFTGNEITTAGFAVFNDAACSQRTVIDATKNPVEVPVFHYDEDLGGAVSEKFMKTQDYYYVKEVEVPAGYKDPGTVWTVMPGIGDVAQLTVENTPVRCDVTADKKDIETGDTPQGDATLEGAVYGLYAAEDIIYPDGSGIVTYNSADPVTSTKGTDLQYMEVPAVKDALIATVKTDSNSEFAFGNLYLGNYYIKEIKESEGYLLNETVYNVNFREEANTHQDISVNREVTETPKKQPFQILKVSTDGDEAEPDKVQGAEFTVKLKSDIDKNGWDNAAVYDVFVTDEEGYARSKELPYGTYIVRETKTPKDLYKTDDFTVTITEDSREPQAWRTVNDAPFKAYIRIIKKDSESGETILLPGTTFKIKKAGEDEDSYIEQKVGDKRISEFETDETGTVTTPLKLKYGEYEVTEIKAPEGYLITEESMPFTVTKEGAVEVLEDEDGDAVITVVMEDSPVKGSIKIHKEGEVLEGTAQGSMLEQMITAVTGADGNIKFSYKKVPLKGAVYHLVADEDIYTPDNQKDRDGKRKIATAGTTPVSAGAIVAVLTTDENGEAEADNLPLGKYRIEEVEAPEGFVLDATAKKVELSYEDDETEVVYKNVQFTDERVRTHLSLVKKNSVNGVPVEGALYGVYAAADIVLKNGTVFITADSLIESVKTDSEGRAVFEADLPLGRYYVKEIETVPGYIKDETRYDVDFTYSDPNQALISKDIEVMETSVIVEVSKNDMTTGKDLAGASLEIIDENGDVYAEWTSDGTPYTINAMPAGNYTLRETFAPYGYLIANEVRFSVEETGEIQKVSMTDERVKGFIEIYKTDSKTKKPIKGVEFEIRDENGRKIQTLVTDKDGYARSKELDICTYRDNGSFEKDIPYIVVETKAAKGYIPDNGEHRVVIQYDDCAQETVGYTLYVTNKPDEPLPQTGGDYNPWIFRIVGGSMVFMGIVMFFWRRKKTRRAAR